LIVYAVCTILLFITGLKISTEAQCAVAPAARTECGFPTISKEECVNSGCCFDSRTPGVLWCFNIQKSVEWEEEGIYATE
uniref:P-type domain-containing protein n=1 Tax=Leptobrachium leishanense TaxID=445787 RepID=A0A8C5P8K1_9ANUR